MKLNCLHCGHTVDLHNDYDDYDGMVKCFVCGALLTVLTENGNVKRVLLTPRVPKDQNNDAALHSMSS